MLADYMEKGFLDNIVDMFRHDSSLYELIADLIQDERTRVRIGFTALMEELKKLDPDNVVKASCNLIPLLSDENAVVRGDALNLLGIIGQKDSLQYIRKSLSDPDENVRLIAAEIITEMQK